MALNFRVNRQKKDGSLHLTLTGDFDGASALELVQILENNSANSEVIYVDTCGLQSVDAFGQDVFVKHCAISPIARQKLVFYGLFSDRITPKGAFALSNNQKIRRESLN